EAKALSTHKAAKVSAQRFSVLARLIFRPSRKTMHRPNDRYSVDGDRAATLLGADHMRQFRRPDRSRRIYFRSPWYPAIGVASSRRPVPASRHKFPRPE